MNPIGISFELGRDEEGWFVYVGKIRYKQIRPSRPSKDGVSQGPAKYGGFKLDLLLGPIVRPIPKFYKKEFYSTNYFVKEPKTNPWNSGNHWFIFRLPVFPAFFLSIALPFKKKQPGFYFGFKTSIIRYIEQALINYPAMLERNKTTGVYSERAIYFWEGGVQNSTKTNYIPAWGSLKKDQEQVVIVPSMSMRDDLVDDD